MIIIIKNTTIITRIKKKKKLEKQKINKVKNNLQQEEREDVLWADLSQCSKLLLESICEKNIIRR